MREVKFRGKTKDGVWVYGYIEIFINPMGKSKAVIHSFSDWNLNMQTEVDIDSVGQYTGFKDKYNEEIYDGDIFQDEEDGSCERVEWDNEFGGWSTQSWYSVGEFAQCAKELEIFGNTYDNKDLLQTNQE